MSEPMPEWHWNGGYHDGWPYVVRSNSLGIVPQYTQALAQGLAATLGQGSLPPNDVFDTGWQDCTLDDGRAPRPGYAPQARKINNVVYFRGHMLPNGLSQGSPRLFTLPSGMAPSLETRWMGFRTAAAYTPFGGWFSPSDRGCYMQIPESPPGAHFCILVSPWLVD